jgi:hypothetical protein
VLALHDSQLGPGCSIGLPARLVQCIVLQRAQRSCRGQAAGGLIRRARLACRPGRQVRVQRVHALAEEGKGATRVAVCQGAAAVALCQGFEPRIQSVQALTEARQGAAAVALGKGL